MPLHGYVRAWMRNKQKAHGCCPSAFRFISNNVPDSPLHFGKCSGDVLSKDARIQAADYTLRNDGYWSQSKGPYERETTNVADIFTTSRQTLRHIHLTAFVRLEFAVRPVPRWKRNPLHITVTVCMLRRKRTAAYKFMSTALRMCCVAAFNRSDLLSCQMETNERGLSRVITWEGLRNRRPHNKF